MVSVFAFGTALVQSPTVSAGATAPTPTCQGEPATLFFPSVPGSATAVQGTDDDDVIVTGRGQDSVNGGAGRDLICTRGGKDSVRGGRGDDRVRGGPRDDRLFGNKGLDRAFGGRGADDVCAAEREKRCEANVGD